jgi:uncharacterized protein
VDPAPRQQDLDRLITDFTERVPTVLHALVVSSDGVPVAVSDRMQPDHLEQLSAITSGLMSLAYGAARIFDGGAITQALVAMQRGTLVIMTIDDGSGLAVLAAATADLDDAGGTGRRHLHPARSRRGPRPGYRRRRVSEVSAGGVRRPWARAPASSSRCRSHGATAALTS